MGGSSAGDRTPLARAGEDGLLCQAVQRKRRIFTDRAVDRKAFLEMLELPVPEKIVAVETRFGTSSLCKEEHALFLERPVLVRKVFIYLGSCLKASLTEGSVNTVAPLS